MMALLSLAFWKDLIAALLKFVTHPIGIAIICLFVGWWFGSKWEKEKYEAIINQSKIDAAEMDQRIDAAAKKRIAAQQIEADQRANEAERKLNDYIERNKDNPSCSTGDDDMRQFDIPSWLRNEWRVPETGSPTPRR